MRLRKFDKFKEWLSIEDAAKRLSISAGADISEAEILRLSLDGHLTLSVFFVNPVIGERRDIDSIKRKLSEYDETQAHQTAAEYQAWLDSAVGEWQALTDQYPAGFDQDHELEALEMLNDKGLQNPQTLEGLWDLPMIGKEALEVRSRYQSLTGGVVVNRKCIYGLLVKKHDKPELFELFQWDSVQRYYFTATSLLEDGMLVVRSAALHEFEERMRCSEQSPEGEKPSNLLAVAGMLELLTEASRRRYTQDSIAEEIIARYPDWVGCSKSNLTKLFAKANAAARDANKEAQAKADARQASVSRVTARKAATV